TNMWISNAGLMQAPNTLTISGASDLKITGSGAVSTGNLSFTATNGSLVFSNASQVLTGLSTPLALSGNTISIDAGSQVVSGQVVQAVTNNFINSGLLQAAGATNSISVTSMSGSGLTVSTVNSGETGTLTALGGVTLTAASGTLLFTGSQT